MKFEAQRKADRSGECRALVPLTTTAAGAQPRAGARLADAAFVAQLAANAKGFAQYRARRRAKPEAAAQSYRATVAAALAYRPNGTKLNYCA